MHLAHSTLRTVLPFSATLTVCRLARKVRLVAFLDQGLFCPKVVVFPQCAHFAIVKLPFTLTYRLACIFTHSSGAKLGNVTTHYIRLQVF